MKFQTLLWDLDGTLVDSAQDIATAVNLARAELGHGPLELATVKGFVGDGVQALIKRSVPEADREPGLKLFWKHYDAHSLDTTLPYPGLQDVLDKSQAAGAKMGIVTNKPFSFSQKIVSGLGWQQTFGALLGGDSPHGRKPAPAPIRAALEMLGTTTNGALMIGDSINDVLSARAAGIPVCGVLFGIGEADKMRELKPDYLAETPHSLFEILGL